MTTNPATDPDDPFADLASDFAAEAVPDVQGVAVQGITVPPPGTGGVTMQEAADNIKSAAAIVKAAAASIAPKAHAVPHKHVTTTALDVSALSNLLYFRQSMLKDYLTCPQMTAYRWIMGMEQTRAAFFSSFMGTAGHAVIFLLHHNRRFNYQYLELMELFEIEFRKAVMASPVPPKLGKAFKTVDEELRAKMDDYLVMIDGYMRDPRNHSVYPVMQEQLFVLEVESDISGKPSKYLFTGAIDMGLYHQDGRFGLRDFKFRENSFKPNKTELDLDLQMTLYALAAARGYPACQACRPRYEGGGEYAGLPGHEEQHVVYDGPCSDCIKKMDGKRWPRRYANPCELVWMRDYERHKEDQYEKEIMDKTKPKVKGPKGGMMFQRVPNPEWGSGYKRGDYKGKCLYPTHRDPALLDTLLTDILRMCDAIRRGEIYRRPGEQCAFWCQFRDPCLAGIKAEVNEKYLMESNAFASSDLDD